MTRKDRVDKMQKSRTLDYIYLGSIVASILLFVGIILSKAL